ncbi:MAG: hypothetical protein JO128_02895 [Alphaproteobacteria bacterium]|nr:hypothetical protein [Alphaproteobacteria bacterium]
MGRRVAASGMLFATALALGACAGPVEVVSANPQVITIRHSPDARYQSDSEAQRYCGQYNKAAHWRTSNSEPTNQQLTIYDCVPM